MGTANIEKMAAFYEKVFGRVADMQSENWHGWQVGSGFFSVGEHSEVSGEAKEPARIMFNLETVDVQEEYERLVTQGATSIKEPYEMGGGFIATLADPDGNYFQLMTPWETDDEDEIDYSVN